MGETILLPVDESPLSARAIEFAGREHPEATVHLLHALDQVESNYDFDGTSLSASPDGQSGRIIENGRRVLADARESAAATGLDVAATELASGRPASQITTYAAEHGVDHIVMGSHGRTGLSRILLGSVTERVLRNSTVPVTVVR
ncbi:UpsA domain-containing protein [Halorhabdus tiamatea SARL4B]|uniref:Universal stress protein A (UpsA) domain protein n=1 Tax=Halorhabdus tiamatea SARL4B TaxID=1033806 RepID=F7PIR8_9EURY|nr:universal stress protein [Halorhabdus tiamatea]ERJ05411.1 UpsA domain-containing protein [Halorhabdus tiamatea SARL4B]CCQ33363.1 universal stress protein A (UpsA) domain protein [Halorhabdus tiamatea SARL4B]